MADENDLNEEFGAQADTEAGAAGAGGYVANFDGDEIDGKRYALGDKIDSGVDPATIAFLVQNGRITAIAEGTDPAPAGGDAITHGGSPGDSGDITSALSAEEKDRVASLVDGNSADELGEMADEAGVSKTGTKAEVAERIVRAERSE